jgi:chromosome partitioning protein
MNIAILSNKGGVGKTTTAIHLAAHFQRAYGSAVLLDGDLNGSAQLWNAQGPGFDFPVLHPTQADQAQAEHVIVDAAARPTPEDIAALDAWADVIVVPTMTDILCLGATLKMLQAQPFTKPVRVLFTMVEPELMPELAAARDILRALGFEVLKGMVHHRRVFTHAQKAGVMVDQARNEQGRLYSTGRRAWWDYRAVGTELEAIAGIRKVAAA